MADRIIVFGELPIATKVASWVCEQPTLELVGVVVANPSPHNNDPWPDVPMLFDWADRRGVKIYRLNELVNTFAPQELTLGVLACFGKVVRREVIELFRKGIVNMHGGLLPEFAGLYSSNHVILCNSPVAGGTIHYIDEGIDTGDVICRCEFPVSEDDTAYSVFQKTQRALFDGIVNVIPQVLEGVESAIPISELVAQGRVSRYFNARSISDRKLIDLHEMSDEEILRHVRAFDFPGYEPAYALVEGRKIYLRLSDSNGGR